ncbi:hypothetical protein H6F98_01100 [Microcoleus sp. FACHB-SPT15]|uniref:hypothetical protein n=1 Tax=Microcoleus sp. FACHB-SPT15 TaxID=2692830 RepID=UPI00177C3585|nr:hypothetical protein [Microcoleus sp. FACHB-SPT15]MBD1804072.1 hypothetical protein [Microcoleus sp. FACHB-SPT15]
MNTIPRTRLFIVIAAFFLIGMAFGLLLYPSIGSPTGFSIVLVSLSGLLILISLLWERS